MKRIDGPGQVGNRFVGGNPALDIDGSVVTPDWANNVQEEIVGVILAEGITLDGLNFAQLQAALLSLVYRLTGGRLSFTAPGNLTAGDPLLVVDTFGVVEATVLAAAPAKLILRGTFTLPKATGQTWTPGQVLYWNGTALTTTAAANRKAGVAAASAISGATTGSATLSGPPNLV